MPAFSVMSSKWTLEAEAGAGAGAESRRKAVNRRQKAESTGQGRMPNTRRSRKLERAGVFRDRRGFGMLGVLFRMVIFCPLPGEDVSENTPSRVTPRLMQAPAASHLPPKGEAGALLGCGVKRCSARSISGPSQF